VNQFAPERSRAPGKKEVRGVTAFTFVVAAIDYTSLTSENPLEPNPGTEPRVPNQPSKEQLP